MSTPCCSWATSAGGHLRKGCTSPKDIYHLKYHWRCAYQHPFKVLVWFIIHFWGVWKSESDERGDKILLNCSFTDAIFGNFSDTPSLQNSKINPLVINVESQRQLQEHNHYVHTLWENVNTVFSPSTFSLPCIQGLQLEEDPPGRWLAQISVME